MNNRAFTERRGRIISLVGLLFDDQVRVEHDPARPIPARVSFLVPDDRTP
jgi:hypothetical protein